MPRGVCIALGFYCDLPSIYLSCFLEGNRRVQNCKPRTPAVAVHVNASFGIFAIHVRDVLFEPALHEGATLRAYLFFFLLLLGFGVRASCFCRRHKDAGGSSQFLFGSDFRFRGFYTTVDPWVS